MFIPFAVISLLTAAAVAQSSTAATATATTTANPLIPTGISSTCTQYLQTFDQGTDLTPCLGALTNATKVFAPGGNATSANINSALSSVCAASTTSDCSSTTIRTELANFQTACTAELTTNKNVSAIYEVLYSFLPLQNALCSTDDNGSYCVAQASQYSQTASSTPKNISYTPVTGGLTPNLTSIGAANLLFMYLNANTPSSLMCSTCTRKILTSYINWESATPFAPGIANSQALAGQTPLYNSINTNCGTQFLSGAVQAAGSLSGGSSSDSNAALSAVADVKTVIAVAFGIAAALVSFH